MSENIANFRMQKIFHRYRNLGINCYLQYIFHWGAAFWGSKYIFSSDIGIHNRKLHLTMFQTCCLGVFCEKRILTNSPNLTIKYLYWSFFFNRFGDLQHVTLSKEGTLGQVFYAKYPEILQYMFFIKHLCTNAFV